MIFLRLCDCFSSIWVKVKEGENYQGGKKSGREKTGTNGDRFLINSFPHNQKPAISPSVWGSSPTFYCKKVIQKLLIVENGLD